MGRGIPTCRLWRVTFIDGAEVEVTAPTRRLALLNVRGMGYWKTIRSIGVIRKGALV
jgi:hypothetical protein